MVAPDGVTSTARARLHHGVVRRARRGDRAAVVAGPADRVAVDVDGDRRGPGLRRRLGRFGDRLERRGRGPASREHGRSRAPPAARRLVIPAPAPEHLRQRHGRGEGGAGGPRADRDPRQRRRDPTRRCAARTRRGRRTRARRPASATMRSRARVERAAVAVGVAEPAHRDPELGLEPGAAPTTSARWASSSSRARIGWLDGVPADVMPAASSSRAIRHVIHCSAAAAAGARPAPVLAPSAVEEALALRAGQRLDAVEQRRDLRAVAAARAHHPRDLVPPRQARRGRGSRW